ncbi:hypothetical protein [Sporosarcina sp. Te-1]|uniref:hypothetical protein n=1 Tax=Sporosarcina sp. Te-1 TaxID=2818390 RepID=UPI001A9CD20B|nr:hypothetical protein [Sporosarcina sp. Te-1]QTD40822.1 hypothetical protein J3U78_19075 [Sporosarcina sp. Te-1]
MILNDTTETVKRQVLNKFLIHTFTQPLVIQGIERRIFIWGHEVVLPIKNGKYTRDSLDLIGTDETGDVWLIVYRRNDASNAHSTISWNQLNAYANTLRKWTEPELVLSARRYLLRESSGLGFPPFLPHATSGLSDAFGQWAMTLGKKYVEGLALYEMTMQKIKNKEAIQCVLTDQENQTIWNHRPSDTVTCRSLITFSNEKAEIVMDGPTRDDLDIITGHWKHGSWTSSTEHPGHMKPSPERIPFLLADSVIPTYHAILSFMQEIGWDGTYTANQRAFRIDLPTIHGTPVRIHIGWVNTEEQNDIPFRTPHQLGLKFNIDFKHFIHGKDKELWEAGYALAKQLAARARYHNKGTEFSILDPSWTIEQVRATRWEGEMNRYVHDKNRNYIGLPEEQQDLAEVFRFLREVVSGDASASWNY